MPLLDHFHPPLDRRSWESFHGWWGFQLAGRLNMRPLPHGFIAEGNVHIGATAAVDVAAFEEDAPAGETLVSERDNGAVATEVWAPPRPLVAMRVDFAALETFEIRIYDEPRARTLVAVVELISPGNKDRPETRRAFLDKCAAYLREGISVVLVDVVTSRQHNFHAALMELFHGPDEALRAVTSELYAVAYRVVVADTAISQTTHLEMWAESLAVGAPLPTMPLWLTPSLCMPLELEAAYRDACRLAGIG